MRKVYTPRLFMLPSLLLLLLLLLPCFLSLKSITKKMSPEKMSLNTRGLTQDKGCIQLITHQIHEANLL